MSHGSLGGEALQSGRQFTEESHRVTACVFEVNQIISLGSPKVMRLQPKMENSVLSIRGEVLQARQEYHDRD
ncbi:hypothetical protein ColKHC_14002 [Colletotrichum higginsianum]|nr:hypothetical protein ColKHC_14002 [Colletotrichum higginsianum]